MDDPPRPGREDERAGSVIELRRPIWDHGSVTYLDHAATSPMRPEVQAAMAPFGSDAFGNPSGSHGVSRRAKNALEESRERVAAAFGCHPNEIVFTGGGTEADNLAIKGTALADGVGGVLTVATEHEAVLESTDFIRRVGGDVRVLGVDRIGRVDPAEVAAAITDGTAVVSVMWANNETGTLQPLTEIREGLDGRVVLHTDAVQAFVSCDVTAGDADLISIAGHKLGGPKGVGALYVRDGIRLEPVVHGGGQELGRRSGTSNVAGIVGLARAVELAVADREDFRRRVGAIRERFESELAGLVERTVPVGDSLVQHSHVRLPGTRNETVLIQLDRAGVAASSASACQSGANTVSHVLEAMGIPEPRECLRFSFGWDSTLDDAVAGAAAVRTVVGAVA